MWVITMIENLKLLCININLNRKEQQQRESTATDQLLNKFLWGRITVKKKHVLKDREMWIQYLVLHLPCLFECGSFCFENSLPDYNFFCFLVYTTLSMNVHFFLSVILPHTFWKRSFFYINPATYLWSCIFWRCSEGRAKASPILIEILCTSPKIEQLLLHFCHPVLLVVKSNYYFYK